MEITDDLYRQIARSACAAARKLGRLNAEDGEDLTQAVALKLWLFRDRVRSPERLLALAYRTAARTWLNIRRSQLTRGTHLVLYREQLLAARESLPGGLGKLDAAEIRRRVAELDPRLGGVIRRHFFDGQSYVVIGRELGVSKSTVCNLVRKGLRRLSARLADANDAHRRRRGAGRRRKDFRQPTLAIARKSHIETGIAAGRAARPRKKRGQSCPKRPFARCSWPATTVGKLSMSVFRGGRHD